MGRYNSYSFEGALEKAFWISKHLLDGGTISRKKLMNEFEMSCPAARRWIAAASRQLPLIEIGRPRDPDTDMPNSIFGLMK
jgi:hypothetical protein